MYHAEKEWGGGGKPVIESIVYGLLYQQRRPIDASRLEALSCKHACGERRLSNTLLETGVIA